jgi:hypothetical protein
MSKEHIIQPVLEHLQLSVQDLSQYLGIDVNNLRHAAAGRREFTREQMRALVKLDTAVDQGLKSDLKAYSADELLERARKADDKEREERIWKLQIKLRKMRTTLTDMEQTFPATQKVMNLLQYLTQLHETFSEDQMRWIKDQLSAAETRLVENSPSAQLNARATIAAIEAELDVLTQA